MILVFAILRPYRDQIVNSFSVINEFFCFLIGCYLFIFMDENLPESTSRFYCKIVYLINECIAWIIIGLVVLMVVINLCFIFPYKIYEMIQQLKEKRRIARLRLISEVEQKYLFFDYRKFFLSTLSIHAKRDPSPPTISRPKKRSYAVRPTEVYQPTDEDEVRNTEDGDRIPTEAYSSNQPL